jgi:acyl dehydratase
MSDQELLTYDSVEVGTEFAPYIYHLKGERVRQYIEATQDSQPIFKDLNYAKEMGYRDIPAPPTTAAIYATRAHKQKKKLPPGGIHAKQMFRFLKPVYPDDTLTSYAKVADKYIKKGRKYVVIEVTTKNQWDETVVTSKSTGIWPE